MSPSPNEPNVSMTSFFGSFAFVTISITSPRSTPVTALIRSITPVLNLVSSVVLVPVVTISVGVPKSPVNRLVTKSSSVVLVPVVTSSVGVPKSPVNRLVFSSSSVPLVPVVTSSVGVPPPPVSRLVSKSSSVPVVPVVVI